MKKLSEYIFNERVFIGLVVVGASFFFANMVFPVPKKKVALENIEFPDFDEHAEIKMPDFNFDPALSADNPLFEKAYEAMLIYIKANNDGLSSSDMIEINRKIVEDYGVHIVRRKLDKKIVVSDLHGTNILEYAI